MRNTSPSNWLAVGALAAMLSFNASAMTSFLLDLDTEFSGGVPPDNPTTPWLTSTFTTVGSDVLFTLTATANLTDPESAKEFYFNFDDALDVTLLSFGSPVGTSGSFDLPTISLSQNAYMADGDGNYDILLGFNEGGVVSQSFSAGDEISYLISYGPGAIVDSDFAYLSEDAGGAGPFYAAAQIQSTGPLNEDSGWIAATTVIPEPSSIALAFLGLAGLGSTIFRRRNNH